MKVKFATLVDAVNHVAGENEKGIRFIEGNDKEIFWPYSEIYSKALRVAAFLQSNGLRKGHELVFQLKDNKDFIVVFWACLLTGVIPVPLTMGVSEEQKLKLVNVWRILNNPMLIIAKADAEKIRLSVPAEQLLFTEDMFSVNGGAMLQQPAENDIAFIQFSSGSTGAPKGVVLTHKNLLTNIAAIHNGIHSPEQGDSFYSWMPLTHDMGLIGFHLTPLFKGWTHYIMPTDLFIRNPLLWLKKVTEHRISFTSSPNFGYRYVLKHFREGAYELDLSSLRVIVNGAEPISAELCREFTEKMMQYGMPKNTIFPVYGLAEASLAVSFSEVNKDIITFNASRKQLGMGQAVAESTDDALSLVEVGTPINDCAVKIADDKGNEMGDGVVGNILIKGDNVTAAYYNNEKATRETISADGWLRTGDLGFVKNGKMYITGRSKDVIFINGQNFYSHDVERCAEQVEGVELGKVVATGFFDEREKVVLFLFHKGENEAFVPRVQALKKHLNTVLGFEVDAVIPVKEIKKTTSGKLQRYLFIESYKNGEYKEIEQEINDLLNAQQFRQPATEAEQQLWQVWCKVLGHSNFGVKEKFFEVGGNSLRAAEVAAYLDVELKYETLFEKQTIEQLAKELELLPKAGKKPLQKSGFNDRYPLAPVQQRLYYTWEMDRNSIGYNNPVVLEISSEINLEKLVTAMRAMIARHEVLRTSFHGAYQQVHEEVEFCLGNSFEVRPFDLQQAPLFRASASKDTLFLDFHHIVADGLSIQLFVEELFRLYNGETLQPLQWQYRDYVEWQLTDENKGREFWAAHLGEELPLLNLPTEQRPPVLTHDGAKIKVPVNAEQLNAFAKANNFSPFMLTLGIYNIFLSKLSSKEDIVIGVPVAGRNRLEFENMMGMFVNNIAIKINAAGDKTFYEFMQEVRQTCFDAFAHQDYDFGLLVEKYAKLRDVSRNPVFDTMLLYQNMGTSGFKRRFFDPGFSKYDLSLEVFEDEFYFEYNTDLFTPDAMERFAANFTTLAQNLLSSPTKNIGDVSILNEAERKDYLEQFNDTAQDYPAMKIADGDGVAIEYGDHSITYTELNEAVNRLARVLPDGIIAIKMERCPELVISMLAILQAGAAFLPLDIDLPEERINFLIQDSKASLVITKENYHELLQLPVQKNRQENDLAYVIYTSGTTGKPKGVMVGREALSNYSCWAAETYFGNGQVKIPLYTSISFDLTITSIFPPLISGNTIVIYNDDEQHLAIEKVLREDKVNVMKLTPSHLKMLRSLQGGHALRKLIVGGEDLSTQLAAEISSKYNVEIFNEYGPTEATVGCMIYRFDQNKAYGKSVPIGVPIKNAAIYVLDQYLQPLPIGVEGDMYIGGKCLAQGYLFREELTAQRFIANPFRPGERMYATGDRARRLPDGNLDYLGRIDNQVKMNGYRIELAEIEAQLKQQPGVEDVVVTANNYLCAYVVGDVDTRALRARLQEKLPAYMVPAHFMVIDEIPLTRNGKIETGKLPLPEFTNQSSVASNSIEQLLVEIWQEVLNVPTIGTQDNFFHLGGDSIKAMQIVSKLQQSGYRAGIKEVMRCQTIEQLAPHVLASKAEYEQGKVRGTAPLTPVANWFFAQQFTNPGHFNQSVVLHFPNGVDKEKLKSAFNTIIKHHDGLRINYDPVNQCFVYNEHAFSFATGHTFDLEKDLLIKAAFISENHLQVTAHHLVIDGVSWRILLEDLYNAYHSKQLPSKTASLIDLPQQQLASITPVHYGTVNDMRTISFDLPAGITFENNISIEIILLTALLRSSGTKLLVEMEHHGRTLDNIDVSRTIGWFTKMYPAEFKLKGHTIQEQLAAVREQLNNNHPSHENPPSIRFNYLGHFELRQFSDLFEITESGADVAAENQLTASMELLFMIRNNKLIGTVNYSSLTENKDSVSSMISSLKRNFTEIVECLENRGSTKFTPLEFETAGLDQEELDSLFS